MTVNAYSFSKNPETENRFSETQNKDLENEKSKITQKYRMRFIRDTVLLIDDDAVFIQVLRLSSFLCLHEIISRHVRHRWYGSKNVSKKTN